MSTTSRAADPGPVVITGAGGYVGGRLVRHLRARGVPLRPLLRTPVPWVPDGRSLDLVRASTDELVDACDGAAAVVHLAGASEVRASTEPDAALADTVVAARRVAQATADAGVRRLVYLSTVHVYGPAGSQPRLLEETTLPRPRHPYAIARLAGEHLCAGSGVADVVALRLTNSVGAPLARGVDRWTLVANELCAAAADGNDLVLRSSGRQVRDFIDLEVACGAIADAALEAVPAGTYNLGSGVQTTVLSLADAVADAAERVLGRRPAILAPEHEGPLPPADVVDVRALAAHLGPLSSAIDGALEDTIRLCAESR